ncbi:hypothetical protein [Treponema parvum]|uniref:hypothetical protein n=1 Tax=Treponema parvum TaxID=138851 RepID=UPI00211E222D|nr:hypothetical protein [Treponema parvum]
MEYMNGVVSDKPFIRKIDRYIRELKENEERRKEYMLIQSFEMDARRDGIQQGIKQGIQQGIEQGFADGSYKMKKSIIVQTLNPLKCSLSCWF